MTKLSVVIPVYNQEILVKRALESIPASCEIIIVDDGSIDGTMKTLLEFMNSHSNVEVLYNSENMGVSHTLNRGIEAATGDYIVFLGSDDYLYTSEFERLMTEMDGTDLIYFDLQINDESIIHLCPETKTTWCGSVKLMRRAFVGRIRNRVDKRSGEDWYFYKRLLKKNPTEKFTNIVAKHYDFPRIGSLTHVANKEQL